MSPSKTRLNYDGVLSAVKGVSQANPHFISVTCGADAGKDAMATVRFAGYLEQQL